MTTTDKLSNETITQSLVNLAHGFWKTASGREILAEIERRYGEYKNQKPSVLGRPAEYDEVEAGKAEWCWTCGNEDCANSRQDELVMCKHHVRRSDEDMKADPHYAGH